jgi:hypothetical protein
MQHLTLPTYTFQLKQSAGKSLIFDPVRRKYVALTPEEWVRQHFINYLIHYLHYPKSLIAVERGTFYHQMAKRTDLCIYGSDRQPLVLVECKAPNVAITAEVVKQATLYNKTLQAKYVILTNGIEHFCWLVDFTTSRIQPLDRIPDYRELVVLP